VTGKEFMKVVANGEVDVLQLLLDILEAAGFHKKVDSFL
jgi:hypothetical protein